MGLAKKIRHDEDHGIPNAINPAKNYLDNGSNYGDNGSVKSR